MLLIFGDEGPDLREFPDLMTQRLAISAGERTTTTAAGGRQARHERLALFGRDEVTFVFLMTGLSTRPAPRLLRGA